MKTEIKKRAPVARDLLPQKVVYQSDVTPTANGNYITTTNDVKANLTALDTQLKAASDAAAAQSYTIAAQATPETGFAATYVLQKGGVDVSGSAKINIPKDMVVESGSVVDITFSENKLWDGATDVTEKIKGTGGTATAADAGKYVKLVIANAASTALYINAKDLVDTYTAEQNATQVQLAIDANNVISATIVAGSVTATELAANAVETAKIKDGNVTYEKLSATVQASLDKADTALQSHQDISGKADKVASATSGNFAGLDSNGNLTDSGKSANDFVDKNAQATQYLTNGLGVGTSGDGAVLAATGVNITSTVDGQSKQVIYGNGAIINGNSTAVLPSQSGTLALTSDIPSVTGFAEKVSGATSGNFAGLDSNGNLTDSGSKASDFKTKQTAYNSDTETASGTAQTVITKVTQNANGEVTVVKANLPAAVKPNWNAAAGDAAEILNKPLLDGTYDQTTNKIATQSTVTNAINALDVPAEGTGAITGMGAGKTIATLTETDGKVAATFQDIQIAENQVTNLTTDLAAKVDKVSGATADHIATFVSGGGIQDSGKVVGDFATAAQGALAASAVQSVSGDSGVTVSTSDHAVTVATKVDGSTIEVSNDSSKNLQVKDGGIGTDKLAASAVTTAKIADANVTTEKLATLTSFKLVDTANDGAPYQGQVYQITIDHGVLTVTPVAS